MLIVNPVHINEESLQNDRMHLIYFNKYLNIEPCKKKFWKLDFCWSKQKLNQETKKKKTTKKHNIQPPPNQNPTQKQIQ